MPSTLLDRVTELMPSKPKRDDEPAKIDKGVLRVARIVAAYRNQTLAEYLSERLRPLVESDHTEEVRKEEQRRQSASMPSERPAPTTPPRKRKGGAGADASQ